MRLSLRSVVFLVALLTAQSVCACPEPTMDWSPNPVCVGCQSVLTLDYTPVSGYEVTYGPWVDYIAILPTSNSPTANGVIYNNVTNAVVDWSDPGFCSLVVTSKLDWFCASNNTSGTSTNFSVKPFTVVRMETFKLTDATNANNSKQDTTDSDATPTNNILYLAEDTNGNARVILNLTMTPTNGNAGSLFKWQISGSGWSPASGDFSVGTITSVWTDAGGAVDREFTVTVVCNCGAGGDCVNCTYRRMLKITVIRVDTETVATVPANRSRTKIGIGEEVVCSVVPSMSVNWSVSGGGTNSPATGSSTTFTASKNPSTSTVHAQVGGADCTVTFAVVAPTGMITSLTSDGSLGSPGTNNIGAKSFFDCWVLPNDVSFYKVKFQENIPGESYTWPDGTGGTRPSVIVPWGVGFDNKTTDTVSSGLDPVARIFNGTNYVDFTYGVRVPEEYKNEAGTWVQWLPGENHPRDYRASDRKARTKLEASNTAIGGWMGPWQ